MVKLKLDNQEVVIEKGELISYIVQGKEFMHQKGSPGWRSTDTEMFPIIGPTNEINFRVQTPKGDAIQDQHGLLRELEYTLVEQTDTTTIYLKTYKANTRIKNSKFPDKSTQQWVIWPYNFQFQKRVELKENGLEITFTVSGDKDMAFMLGYHPAFKLDTGNPVIKTADKTISLAEVLAVGSRALQVPNCETISLLDKAEIIVKTEGFGSFMLWTEVPNMVCIEPITYYPYTLPQSQFHEGFQYLGSTDKAFKVYMSVR